LSETSVVAKIILALAVIMLFVNLIMPGQNPAWVGLQATLSTGLVLPTFTNPFDETYFSPRTSIVDEKVTIQSFEVISFVGCENTTTGRVACLNTKDGDSSYVRTNRGVFTWNWSASPGDLDNTKIRRVRFTFLCLTEGNETAATTFGLNWGDALVASNLSCTIGDNYKTLTYDINTPTGIANPVSLFQTDAYIQIVETVAPYFPFIRFSYIEMEVSGEAQTAGCQAPEGAWFPWADEIACAIGRFGDQVYKGVIFFVTGVIFVGQVIYALLSFIVLVIGGFLFGLVSSLGWLLAIPGMPSIAQGFITVIVLGMIGFILLVVLKVSRGSGTVD